MRLGEYKKVTFHHDYIIIFKMNNWIKYRIHLILILSLIVEDIYKIKENIRNIRSVFDYLTGLVLVIF